MLQEFTQEMKNLMLETIRGVHTAIPAKVTAFDPAKCEASVLPYGKYRKPDNSLMDYPLINSVPVYIMQGSGQTATVVWPVKPGDECLLLFSEQALDTWRTGAASDTDLKFDLTNAVAIVGVFSNPNPLMKKAVDNDSIIIQREETFVQLYDGKVEVLVRNKGVGKDAYYLMVDGEGDTLSFKVKSIDDDKESIAIDIDGNAGTISTTTTNTGQEVETFTSEINGQEGKFSFTAKNYGQDKETVVIGFDGQEGAVSLTARNYSQDKETVNFTFDGQGGKINLTTKNYTTDKETASVSIDGQAGKMDLITKNKDTGNETAFIKLDGAAKTIDIQGYVTVKGSFANTPMTIPD